MDKVTWGRGTHRHDDRWAPGQPWHRAGHPKDPRWFPGKGGGRRLRHPFLDSIVYPRVPDRTLNFGLGPLRRVPTIVTKTLDSSAVTRFPEAPEDVIITEIWDADSLSTVHEFFNALHRYWVTDLLPGRSIGWSPRDLHWRNYFVDIIDVQLGPPESFDYQEEGSRRPFYLRNPLMLKMKLKREVEAPSGVVTSSGL